MSATGEPRAPRLAALGATALVAVGLTLRLVDLDAGSPSGTLGGGLGPLLERLVPLLVASGALCVAGLGMSRAPSIAWLATVLAAALGSIEIVGVARSWLASADPTAAPWLTSVAAAAAVATSVIADAFANRAAATLPRGPAGQVLTSGSGLAVVAVVISMVWAIASSLPLLALTSGAGEPAAGGELSPIRVATRITLLVVTALAIAGALAILGPRVLRARRRSLEGAHLAPDDGRGQPARFAVLLGEELLPGLRAGRRGAAEAERERIASDLHARVVPELRRAVAAAEGAADPTADRLRATLDDVEQLMASRHSFVLETFGLVAALEWLAERTEERAGISVQLDVRGLATPDEGRPPPAAERAAFRIGLLAVDNAQRHAPGAAIAIIFESSVDLIHLEIADAGPGLPVDAEARAGRDGRRGLADMRSEAAAAGGRLAIRSPDHGLAGTRITFDWPA